MIEAEWWVGWMELHDSLDAKREDKMSRESKKLKDSIGDLRCTIKDLADGINGMWGPINRVKDIVKCGYADRYQGKSKPTCGCYTCQHKYDTMENLRLRAALQKIADDPFLSPEANAGFARDALREGER
jgi:hypothetical protein